jgi:hypothetical protein
MLDSVTINQIAQVAGTVASNVANQTGHAQYTGLIQTIVSAVSAVLIFVLGHWHGKSGSSSK